MPRLDLIRRPQPFVGLLVVAAGWVLSHQVGSDNVTAHCEAGGGFVILVSLIGLLISVVGGLYSLRAWRASEGPGRKFLGLASALLALLVSFAIVLQIAAGTILPSCAA